MAAAMSNDASLWNQHSPLDTLVRRTSSKRFKQRAAIGYVDQQGGQGYGGYNEQYDESAAYDYNPPEPSTPERNGSQQLATSPLLHSHFARHSTATSSSNDDNSYYIDRSSMGSAATDGVYPPYQYDDDASVYSDAPALRESWQSTATARLTQTGNTTIDEIPGARAPRSPSPNETMPVVVVSSPGGDQTARPVSKGGRAPIAASAQLTANFSRPVRPPTLPPVNAEEQKRLVLERNAARARSPSNPSPQPNQFSTLQQLPPLPRGSSTSSMGSHPSSSAQAQDYGAPPYLTDRSISSHSHRSPSPNAYINPQAPASLRSVASSPNLNPMAGPSRPPPQSAPLSRGAPDGRSGSPTSVYSGYSFYQLPPTPSNELPQPQLYQGNSSRARSPQPAPPPTITVTPSPSYQSHAPAPPGPPNLDNPQTPQDYLQLGIQAHEANKLRDSFDHFEQAAKLQGGCGVGMLMYGLSLRHGWGCEKNEKVGFKWLRRAAESAVEDLESARASKMMDVGAVQVSDTRFRHTQHPAERVAWQSELVLAIYEVGQCFFQGWGVPKDQKMAVVSVFGHLTIW